MMQWILIQVNGFIIVARGTLLISQVYPHVMGWLIPYSLENTDALIQLHTLDYKLASEIIFL